MAKKGKKPTNTAFQPRQAKSHPIIAIILMTLGIMVLVALLDYHPAQSPSVTTDITEQNIVGLFGAQAAYWTFYWMGIGAYLLPLFVLWSSYLLFTHKGQTLKFVKIIAMLVCLCSLSGLGNMAQHHWGPLKERYEAYNANPRELATRESDASPYRYYSRGHGGEVGVFLYEKALQRAVGPFGSFMLFFMAYCTALTLVIADSPRTVWLWILDRVAKQRERWRNYREEAAKRSATEREERAKQRALDKEEKAKQRELDREEKARLKEEAKREKEARREAEKREAQEAEEEDKLREQIRKEAERIAEEKLRERDAELAKNKDDAPEKKPARKLTIKTHTDEDEDEPPAKGPEPAPAPVKKEPAKKAPETDASAGGLKVIAGEEVEKATGHIPQRKGKYTFPTLELLGEPSKAISIAREDYEATAEALVRTLGQFKVDVNLGEIHSGPVITRYEVVPAPGVRVNKIENLDKDLALGMKAQSVRILAPVPGKGTVGIEVPNSNPAPVCLREIVESKAWADSKADIPIVLGKEVTGKPVVIDLTKMPHMLIAGSTGSGKTVCINAVIASLLYKLSPDEVRFIMVDPKVVEMQCYNSLPHMLIPVVTDPKKVPAALKWLIREMERRFQIFAEVGVRNIAGFNAKIMKDKEADARAKEMDADLSPEERAAMNEINEVPRDEGVEMPKEKLPYIVCIIDELADLMMVAPADIEQCIARIAQLARAAGIHLILATQRPSTNVITGVIKANLPTRIAFKVASNTDSRVILDAKGAEALIGKGDMLFIPPGTSVLTRAQGAFVSDDEINDIVDFLKVNGEPIFAEEVQRQIEAEASEGGDDNAPTEGTGEYEDELVPQAIQVIKTGKRASTSYLQRRLKIGYNRAARIMDILEEEGIVGPDNGSSPREILTDLDEL